MGASVVDPAYVTLTARKWEALTWALSRCACVTQLCLLTIAICALGLSVAYSRTICRLPFKACHVCSRIALVEGGAAGTLRCCSQFAQLRGSTACPGPMAAAYLELVVLKQMHMHISISILCKRSARKRATNMWITLHRSSCGTGYAFPLLYYLPAPRERFR